MITLNNYKESTKHLAWDTMPKEYQEGNDFTLEVLGNVAFQNDKEIRDVAEQYVQKLNAYDKFDDNKPVPQKAAEKKAAKKLTDLAAMAKKAAADGKQAPNYNLCEIEVPGTNIFCQDNKGIKRAKMPQLKGMPSAGTQAYKDSKGGEEVDGEAAFKKYLQDQGKTLKDETVLAEDLKSTQNELVGVKVAGMTEALKKDPLNPGITAPIFISQDNYVLDGHHRWAAHVGLNLGNDKDVTMKVVRVNMPIKDLVKAANKFADEYGIKQKAATADKPKLYKIINKATGAIVSTGNTAADAAFTMGKPGFDYNQFIIVPQLDGETFSPGQSGEIVSSKPKQSSASKSNKRKAELNNALEAMVKKAKAGDYRKLNRVELLKVAQQFEKTRSKASQTRDESSSAKKRLTPNPENLVRWMNNPGGFDLIGIDTKDLTDPTANLKISKEIFWRRLGIKMNSK